VSWQQQQQHQHAACNNQAKHSNDDDDDDEPAVVGLWPRPGLGESGERGCRQGAE